MFNLEEHACVCFRTRPLQLHSWLPICEVRPFSRSSKNSMVSCMALFSRTHCTNEGWSEDMRGERLSLRRVLTLRSFAQSSSKRPTPLNTVNHDMGRMAIPTDQWQKYQTMRRWLPFPGRNIPKMGLMTVRMKVAAPRTAWLVPA